VPAVAGERASTPAESVRLTPEAMSTIAANHRRLLARHGSSGAQAGARVAAYMPHEDVA